MPWAWELLTQPASGSYFLVPEEIRTCRQLQLIRKVNFLTNLQQYLPYKTWVPGATLSAGLAIVHCQEDLRIAIEEARKAEQEAKHSGRDGLCLRIARRSGDPQTGLNNLMKAIQIAPNFKPAYELSAQIYESMGDNARAAQFRAATQN